ncbi:putative transmembrane lipoprotein LplB [Streptomyces himastatinicus ATCC 53653]|uniref:Putative transmembrane lipoprotein LplB n=1 Tax=Streptomyces himastatinicus ATCC 53653 TaxID=457427 RepID=D9WB92_9ACTN|nr:putative transmembrane lipoprotein LplB [Streptomyces himastatinicus ATCC 53653]
MPSSWKRTAAAPDGGAPPRPEPPRPDSGRRPDADRRPPGHPRPPRGPRPVVAPAAPRPHPAADDGPRRRAARAVHLRTAAVDHGRLQGLRPVHPGAVGPAPGVGFENFTLLFQDSRFWDAFANTLSITFIQLVLFFPVPVALALLLNSVLSDRLRGLVQSILYLPHFFSWVLVITIFQQMLGGAGLLAQQLRSHGYEGFDLMTDPGVFKFLVTAQLVWKDAGWGVIVFLAALSAVNQDLYEAAAVDGAGRWRRMWHVTLPALRPVIALLLVLRVGDALTVGFEQILLQRDAVGPGASEVFDTYVWWVGIANTDYGIAAAGGLIKGVFSLVLVLIANKVAHMLGEQGVYRK